MMLTRVITLLKTVLIIMLLLNITSCQENNEDINDVNETTEETTIDEEEKIDPIVVWDIEPNLYYDDVMISFKHSPEDVVFINDPKLYGQSHVGSILVENYGKYGLLDENGNTIIKAIYADAIYRSNDVWFTSGGGNGPCAILNYDETITHYDGGCGIGSDGYYLTFKYTNNGYKLLGYGSMDETKSIKERYGDRFLIVSYDEAGIYDYVLIDNDEVTLFSLNPRKNHCFDYSSGIILFSSSWSYYDNYYATDAKYYDEKGNLLFGGFDGGLGFYEGYAPVMKDNKWGYIDMKGNLVIDYVFDAATQIYEGKSWVIINGKLGKLNTIDVIDNQKRTEIIESIIESQSDNASTTESNPFLTGRSSDNLDKQSGIRIYAKNGVTYQDDTKVTDESGYIGHLQLKKANTIRIRDAAGTYGKVVGHIYEYATVPYYGRKTSEGYRWYKISKNHDYWIADDGTWLILGD
ncbi:MAG: WG repeat-containing protein [Erysipelotrichaceae bacterium]|nr:WG repeat-containing protein [Erysipelotrichaceae bacterium]